MVKRLGPGNKSNVAAMVGSHDQPGKRGRRKRERGLRGKVTGEKKTAPTKFKVEFS